MRILHVTDCYLPRIGGIELHVRDLVAHQRLDGHDAAVLTLTPPGAGPDPAWIHRVADTAPTLRQATAALRRLLARGSYDVVHVHVSVFSPFATLAARETGLRGLPTLVTVHSLWTGLGPLPTAARGLLGLRRWPIVWSAVSDRAARPLRELLGPATAVHVLPNAVDPAQWRSAAPTAAELPAADGAPRTVISVMRLTRVKRALPLARILHDVRRRVPGDVALRAVVVGDGPQRPALKRHLHRHGLDWVEVPGRLDRVAIRAELQRASVFLAPAERESFGIAPLEARVVGLPVVASSRSGVGDFIRPGVHGLLGVDDRDLAAKVATLLTDDTLRTTIAAHNRRVPTSHDWPAACRSALELYDAAVDLSAGRVERPVVVRR